MLTDIVTAIGAVVALLIAAYFYGENEDTRGLEQATKPL